MQKILIFILFSLQVSAHVGEVSCYTLNEDYLTIDLTKGSALVNLKNKPTYEVNNLFIEIDISNKKFLIHNLNEGFQIHVGLDRHGEYLGEFIDAKYFSGVKEVYCHLK